MYTTTTENLKNLMNMEGTEDALSWIKQISSLVKPAREEGNNSLADSIVDWSKEYTNAFLRFVRDNEPYVYQLIDSSVSQGEESIGYFYDFKDAFEIMNFIRKTCSCGSEHTFVIRKHQVGSTSDEYGFKNFFGLRFNANGQLSEILVNEYFWLDEILLTAISDDCFC